MLRRISEPLALSEASLLALRPALNAPVLNVDFLPIGPARAAIVVFAEEYGGIGLAVGIRSSEGGQVAVFKNAEPLDESIAFSEVLEPALSAAERMGFLFDEDMLEDAAAARQGRSEATALWGRLMGNVAMPSPPEPARPQIAATGPVLDLTEPIPTEEEIPELVLDERASTEPEGLSDPVEIELAVEATAADVSESQTGSGLVVPQESRPVAPSLSKFRHVERRSAPVQAADGDTTQSHPSSHLGRVPLVRVRRSTDGLKRIPYLARLLSSF